jgi:hypothetical protein
LCTVSRANHECAARLNEEARWDLSRHSGSLERPVRGQSATPIDATELSKEVENPATRRITLPLRYEADFDDGAYKAIKDTFEID